MTELFVGFLAALFLAVPSAAPPQPPPSEGVPPISRPAAACVNISLPQALATANTVAFVGTPSSVSDNGLTAHVVVESVWVGSNPFPLNVDVVGGDSKHPFVYARHFVKGTKYLFVEKSGALPYQDSACSPTRIYSPALDSLRPAGAHAPLPLVPTSDTASAVGHFLPWVGVLGLVVVLTLLLAWRDRSTSV